MPGARRTAKKTPSKKQRKAPAKRKLAKDSNAALLEEANGLGVWSAFPAIFNDMPPRLSRAVAEGMMAWRRKPKMSPSEWARDKRIMSGEGSQRVGPWNSELTPFADAIMDSTLDSEVHKTIALMAAQTVKTEIILNVTGYLMDMEPCPILIGQPTVEPMARAFSKDRLSPMIRDMPDLAKLFDQEEANRNSESETVSKVSNTTLHKKFVGGHVTIAGYNSSSSLASRPVRAFLADEIDRQGYAANPEGDSIDQGTERTASFDNAVILYVTSPGTIGLARSEVEWESSDKQEWFVPCHECGTHQILKWAQVQWDKDAEGEPLPNTAMYVCEKCGCMWNDDDRVYNVLKGEWRPTAPFTGTRGFRLSALNSPWKSRRLPNLVARWYKCKGNNERLKVFTNTVLCEYWRPKAAIEIEADGLQARAEEWDAVPNDVVLITMGVDVQDTRLEYEIVGWGVDEQSWTLQYGVLYGNFKTDTDEHGFPLNMDAQLDRVIEEEWVREDGVILRPRGVAIDSGFATERVLRYTRPRLVRQLPDGFPFFVFAIKGVSDLHGQQPVWAPVPSESKKFDRLPFFPIGVDSAKDQVVARLAVIEGPGACHFKAGRARRWYEGITAEVQEIKNVNGRDRRIWTKKPGQSHNEELDCRVYAYACMCGLLAEPFNLNMEAEAERVVAMSAAYRKTEVTAAAQAAAPRRRYSRGVE